MIFDLLNYNKTKDRKRIVRKNLVGRHKAGKMLQSTTEEYRNLRFRQLLFLSHCLNVLFLTKLVTINGYLVNKAEKLLFPKFFFSFFEPFLQVIN